MSDRSALNEEYHNTKLTLLVNGIDVPLEKTKFTGHIITAWNPYSEKQSDELNVKSNKLLMHDLSKFADSIFDAVGQNEEGTWIEKGFAISGLEDATAIEIGRKFGQNAIFKVIDGRPQVVWCN